MPKSGSFAAEGWLFIIGTLALSERNGASFRAVYAPAPNQSRVNYQCTTDEGFTHFLGSALQRFVMFLSSSPATKLPLWENPPDIRRGILHNTNVRRFLSHHSLTIAFVVNSRRHDSSISIMQATDFRCLRIICLEVRPYELY